AGLMLGCEVGVKIAELPKRRSGAVAAVGATGGGRRRRGCVALFEASDLAGELGELVVVFPQGAVEFRGAGGEALFSVGAGDLGGLAEGAGAVALFEPGGKGINEVGGRGGSEVSGGGMPRDVGGGEGVGGEGEVFAG